jgi:hypothetical protein
MTRSAFLILFVPSLAAAQVSLICASVSNGGTPAGQTAFVVIGEPLVGTSMSGGVGLHSGIVSCLFGDAAGLPCPADMNRDGGVDGSDLEPFFIAWEAGTSDADINADGGVDGGDAEAFFVLWEAGGC